MPATQFKAQCLAILAEVAASGETIVVTKHGKPLACVSPLEPPASLVGSVIFHVSDEELIAPIAVRWEAEEGRL